ncbi:hypothetical protein IV203_013543 [Nitzschia inconspicua]|uniref:Uncharacterized protein n=1 Tax=Nitzschia inconspicua TaxID=303405 RepID=A0A9K3M6F5_9STRA|nr:hypothetical protein IV203_013543 [Nitzschia inconspicua]
MALFGNSFKELLMAEAMLEEEYRHSHDNLSYQNESKQDDDKQDRRCYKPQPLLTSPSALKRKSTASTGDSNSDVPGLRREVVIQLPPKRKRLQGNYSANDIVQALHRAMSPDERMEALENAIDTFDHDDRAKHEHEIAIGADVALVKALVFLEYASGFRREPIRADMDAITKEIGLVLTALECVYRASSESVGESFNRVGKDLLHILVILIDEEVQYRVRAVSSLTNQEDGDASNSNNGDTIATPSGGGPTTDKKPSVTAPSPDYDKASVSIYERDLLLRKATKCLGHFARVGFATKPMAHFPGFLGSTLNLINLRPVSIVPFEARLSCLWIIANLACNTENMTMMSCTPGLLNSLASISCRQAEIGDSLETIMEILRAKSIASRALLNLSWSPENKVLMADSFGLLETLTGLALERRAPYRKSKTMQEIMLQTRRNSIGALRNIAAAPRRSKVSLCEYNNGKLLDTMTDVALNETDEQAVDLAFACIHNLAIHDTAEAMVDRPALVLALKNVLLEDDSNDSNDEAESSKCSRKSNASSTILVLERTITPEMSAYENLRELLDAVNPNSTTPDEDEKDNVITSGAVNPTAV